MSPADKAVPDSHCSRVALATRLVARCWNRAGGDLRKWSSCASSDVGPLFIIFQADHSSALFRRNGSKISCTEQPSPRPATQIRLRPHHVGVDVDRDTTADDRIDGDRGGPIQRCWDLCVLLPHHCDQQGGGNATGCQGPPRLFIQQQDASHTGRLANGP